MSYLYLIRDRATNAIKIGVSDNPQKRLRQLQTGSFGKLELLHTIECISHPAKHLEKRIHHWFRFNLKRGEWRILTEQELEFLMSHECDRAFW